MSKSKPPKKVVVTTTTPTTSSRNTTTGNRPTPTTATRTRQTPVAPKAELSFGKENYIWMGIGVVLIALGLALMAGGQMPSPDVWEPNIIYNFRRVTLAPIVILAGLIIEIYAIFKKSTPTAKESEE